MDNTSLQNATKPWIRAMEAIKILSSDATLPRHFSRLAEIHAENVALLGEHQQFTYRDLAARADQYACWAVDQGLAAGGVVCLLMRNRPEYVAIWLGLSKVGCVAALINTNLTGDGLAHCIRIASARHIIADDIFYPSLQAIQGKLPEPIKCWVNGDAAADELPVIGREIGRYAGVSLHIPSGAEPAAQNNALLIYTSGTTGLPKAAYVTHARIVEWSYWFAGMMDTGPADRLYNCLPMYHSIGGVVAIGAMLVRGGSVLIRARFSATRFWDDITDGDCTIFQYIGELCRYLVNTKTHKRETAHRLRLCCGNGLSGDVWEVFQARFQIPKILEFYAATEGNVSLYNCEGKPGAIGRVPPFLAHRFPIALIKCDTDTMQPCRNESGFCMESAPDEHGEAIGKILDIQAPARRFDGYTDEEASARKILRNVFAEGDCWFRTGDLMRKDKAGYFYFVDRLGDTFRWKGENVSTTEVTAVLTAFPGVRQAAVYGVIIPGHDGRAGMAAITTDQGFSITNLQTHLVANLPDYARPLFIRICDSLEITGTFKLQKENLCREGYNMPLAPGMLWISDRKTGKLLELDDTMRRQISEGTLKIV